MIIPNFTLKVYKQINLSQLYIQPDALGVAHHLYSPSKAKISSKAPTTINTVS